MGHGGRLGKGCCRVEGEEGGIEGLTILTECVVDQCGLSDILKELGSLET